MAEPSSAQRYHLILADIAMAAAIVSCGGTIEEEDRGDYTPGALRDRWLARQPEGLLRRKVCAMANAGVASLQTMGAGRLAETAERWGIPFEAELGERMAGHFEAKREAFLTYKR